MVEFLTKIIAAILIIPTMILGVLWYLPLTILEVLLRGSRD